MDLHRTPDYLAIGHVSKDIRDEPPGYVPGGTALYSALTAQRLGLQAAIVTACAPHDDMLLDAARETGVWVHRIPSNNTTTFRNLYDNQGRRRQTITGRAGALSLAAVPEAWRAATVVHIGPVAQELAPEMVAAFPDALLGITPQGWMRSWDADGWVEQSGWPLPTALESLPANAFVVLSTEDVGNDPRLVKEYTHIARLVAITHGEEDALVCADGACHSVCACSAQVVDATGAGDVFAAALFVRYRETGDLVSSARFAHAAAACAIEGVGASAIPDRATIERKQ
jgi:sugar/nucleoside kinase (ribokinase family)